jgi:predicted deacylase
VTPHGEFDARLVPAVVSIITGAISGCIIFVGSKRPGSIPQVAQPSWVPVKSSELRSLSIHDMNALMEERRAVLLVLSERGLITQNVNELDRKPLGSLD